MDQKKMQGTKRKREETEFTRNVKPRETPMLISILEIKDIFGEIMSKLIRPAKEHDTQYKECTKTDCYCHFAFAFASLSLASKSTYDPCKNYKNAFEERISESKSIPIEAFKMPLDVLCVYAATHGYLELLKYARNTLGAPWFGPVDSSSEWYKPFRMERQCTCSHTIYTYYTSESGSWVVTSNASKHNHRDCLEYAVLNGCPVSENGFIHAAQNGHTECVRFYLNNPLLISSYHQISNALEDAILSSNTECIDLLIGHTHTVSECAIHKCAQIGSIETTKKIAEKFKHENSIPKTDTLYAVVSRDSEDNLSYLKWLIETYQVVLPAQVANKAAHNGSLKCLQFLVSKGVFLSISATECAASNGQLECLKYLHSVGCSWDAKTTKAAAAAQSLDCLKFAYENGCPMHKNASFVTTDLECLKYAHEHGSVWKDDFIAETIAYCGDASIKLIEYAIENGCSMGIDCCETAASGGNLETLKYLHEKGCPWGKTVTQAALDSYKDRRPNSLKCLTYLIQNGCPVPEE